MKNQNDQPLTASGRQRKSQKQFSDNRVDCEFLDSQEAASYLGISPNALRIMVCREKVKTYRLGRRLRFHVNDLRSLFEPLKGG